MNDLEKMFKNGLDDFEEVAPSKSLWWRISSSLFLQKHGGKIILMVALLSMMGIYSINNLYFNNSKSIGKTLNANLKHATNESVVSNKYNENDLTEVEHKDINPEIPVSGSTTHQEEISNTTQKNSATISNSTNVSIPSIPTKSAQKPIRKINPIALSQKVQVVTKNEISKSEQAAKPNNPSKTEITQAVVVTSNSEVIKPVETQISTIPHNNDMENPTSLDQSVHSQQAKSWENLLNSAFETGNLKPLFIPFLFHPKQHFQQIEVYAGPTFNHTIFTTSNQNYKDYITYRNNAETQKITPNFGVNYRYVYKNWFITGGATFHQIRTDADYSLPVNVVDSTINFYSIVRMNYSYVIIGTMPDPNNPNASIPIYGQVSNPDTTQYSEVFKDTNSVLKNFHYTQKYTYYEFPVMLGREFRYKNFVFETSLGVSYSRLTKYETKLPNLTTQNMLSDQQVESIIVQNAFNGIFGFGAAYQLTENKAIFIRPEFKYNFNSMFDKSFPVSQRNTQIRVVMGIRYEL